MYEHRESGTNNDALFRQIQSAQWHFMNEKPLKCYRILGLPPGTLMADVHQKCRELKKVCDPDNFHEPAQKQEAHERRRQIDNASNWLLEFSLYGTSRLHPEEPEQQ